MQQMDLVRVQQHNVMSVNTSPACFTAQQLAKDYPDVFEGTGKLEGQYKLEVKEGATPVVYPPRRVPVAVKGKLKKELDRLQSVAIIGTYSQDVFSQLYKSLVRPILQYGTPVWSSYLIKERFKEELRDLL